MSDLLDYISRHAETRPAGPAVSDPGRSLTWREFADSTDRLAAGLAASGVAPGDRVALLEVNTVAFAEFTIACAKAGAILVPLNWRLAPAELAAALRSAEPRVLLVGPSVAELGGAVAAKFDGCPTIALDGADIARWRDAVLADGWTPAARTAETPVCIAFTSGSTGAPKGVVMSHSAFASVLPGVVEAEGISPDSSCLQVLPLFHIGGLGWLISAFLAGAASVMLPAALPRTILDTVERERITHLCVVSTLLQMILDEQRRDPADVSSVTMIQCGASPMPESYLREAGEVFGCTIVTLYGLSEAGGLVCNQLVTPEDIESGLGRRLLASGWPIDGVELEIRATEPPFTVLAPGEVGEIVTRTPGVMSGYWRAPAATAEVLSEDGWLRTGDLGAVDEDGLLFVKGRVKDLIISGGENIYPAEIENVIAAMDGVAQVAVVGAPHARWGESPVAVVVPEQGAVVSADDVVRRCREELAGYKCPRSIVIAEALPLLGGGKVDRNELRVQQRDAFAGITEP